MGERTGRLVVAWGLAAAVAGCGATASPPAAGATAVIGGAGGAVTEPGGASVVVPPGAFAADTTLRIAKDSAGAPALPQGLAAAGDTYAITPHGGFFTEPVEVRIPAPTTALQPNQELKLAKAQPGGEWEVLQDSVLTDGVLSARVSSFSFFVAVTVSYQLPLLQLAPLQVTASLDCGARACLDSVGTVTATYSVTSNGGQLPAECGSSGVLDAIYGWVGPSETIQDIPIRGATITKTLAPVTGLTAWSFVVKLHCGSHWLWYDHARSVTWQNPPAYPALQVMRAPAQLDVVEGHGASLEVVLSGGAARPLSVVSTTQRNVFATPTVGNGAIIDWQRSADGGASWQPLARSYQDEADPNPAGEGDAWRYWAVRHGFTAAASDQGALIRVHACYTPPDVPAPPCVTGPVTRINVLQQSALPAIVDAPRSVLVTTGQAATFTATAGGAPTPTLQWQTRAANDAGAWADVGNGTGGTTGSYTTAPLSLADNGRQFRVVATNAVASVESPAVTASVSDLDVAPAIGAQPSSLGVVAGSEAVFAVVARGTEVLSYQWSHDGAALAGATGPVLRLPAVTIGSAGAYTVVVSNMAGSLVSDAAILTVSAGVPVAIAPSIVTQPAAVVVDAGNTATFAVGVAGSGPLSFQWRKDGVAIAGATSAAITLVSVTPGDAGAYSVVVSNGAGSATSETAALQVNTAPPPVVTAPTISTQPATLVVVPGAAATLAVAASGTGPLAYQWSHDGAPVAGAAGPVLTLASVGAADGGSYTVTVSNSAGSVTSNPAQLLLVGAPVITTQPTAASVIVGASATFSVSATGAALGYQWLRNGLVVAGATGASYTTLATALADGGAVYGVLVYNGAGVVLSQPAVLTVTAAPVVTGPPQAGKLAASYRHTCAVQADGTLACWGYDSSGQLGAGSYSSWPTPFHVPLPAAVTAVAAGQTATCAIHGAGDLSCWGNGVTTPALVAGFTGVKAVAVGTSHWCFVTASGGVSCRGSNASGQLGDGTTSPSSVPVQVLGAGGLPLSSATALSAGLASTCALLGDGTVMCWGQGFGAVAGPVAGLTGVTALAQGAGAPCALSGDGLVRCWSGGAVPAVVAGISGVTALASGSQHLCAVAAGGAVWCWGTAPMGNGNVSETQPTPTRVSGLTGVGVLAAGLEHTCALRTDRTLTCWGANSEGQLATGDTFPRLTPTDLSGGAIYWGP